MKSRLVILDANVIIEAFRWNIWNALMAQYDIHITPIVLKNEVYHYEDINGQQVPIDLDSHVASGKVKEISATSTEIASLEAKVNKNFLDRIDDGEKEALALLLTGRFDDFRYCTGDTRAIKALASLDLGAFGKSHIVPMKWEQVERLKARIREEAAAPHKAHVGPGAFSAPSDLPIFLDVGSNNLTFGAGDEVRTRDP